jgi:molybdate transport system substrate-binding protein
MAKLKLLCARSMHKVVDSLADDFTRETGHVVEREYGTVGALDTKIAAGESADVLILGLAGIAKLEQAGALVAGSKTPIARTQIGIAVRKGAAAPNIASPEAFERTLVAARAVAFSDPAVGGTAGVYLKELFEQLGLTAEIAAKGMPQKNGAEVARRVAEGAAEIGMTLMAEIAPIPGVTIIGPLPPPLGHGATYAAGVSAQSEDIAAARAFVAHLVRADGRQAWQAAGFEPA